MGSSIGKVVLGIFIGFLVIFIYNYATYRPRPKPIPESLERARVGEVVDGDSFFLADGREVRLIGIDAPECDPSDPYCSKAGEFLRNLMQGKEILLEKGERTHDRYGRLLVYAYHPKTRKMFNLSMIQQGLAYIYFFPDNMRYFEDFRKAQREAREKSLNIWSLKVKKEDHYFVSSGLTHRPDCAKMERSHKKKVRYETREEALDTGSPPCRECGP